MTPALRRPTACGAATRPRRAARAGFTLVEMLISVTLVLLMMLMFAEIYTLAQQTISTQRGIAENDQKARILSEVLRRDLATRTFRSVYPFKLNAVVDTSLTPPVLRPDRSFATETPAGQELIEKRKGYFSYSENHPDVDTDDGLQLTVSVDQVRWGRPGDRIYGKASDYTTTVTPVLSPEERPEFDDAVLNNSSSASGAAEVSYFLRGGNLYRAVLLVRKPYMNPDATSPTDATPPDFPPTYPVTLGVASFWRDFDFSAYRWPVSPGNYTPRFHGLGSLNNNTDSSTPTGAYLPGPPDLIVPQLLSTPHLRFGHISGDSASPLNSLPLEYLGAPQGGTFDSVVVSPPRADFFGRFTLFERSDGDFTFPGSGWSPFDNATVLTDTSPADYVIDPYADGSRRGVDLMLSNVHSFDIKVWDDIIGNFVDLGHELTGQNPYIIDASGAHPVQDGFYHRSRLRRPIPLDTLDPVTQNCYYDHPTATDFGNRYDTWSPLMYVASGDLSDATTQIWRTGRAPYRPQKSNPDPNTAAYNDPTSGALGREPAMVFGNDRLNVDNQPPGGDGATFLGPVPGGPPMPPDPKESDAEAPLRAIQITIRYLDINSGQTRQTTIEQSLID